jgi:hypothetical protein
MTRKGEKVEEMGEVCSVGDQPRRRALTPKEMCRVPS